jgi:hypothetical protein
MVDNPVGSDRWELEFSPGPHGPRLGVILPARPEWKVIAEFVPQGDAFVIGRCTVQPVDATKVPEGGVTALLLRDVPIGRLPGLMAAAPGSRMDQLVRLTMGNQAAEAFHAKRRPGRRGRPDLFYAQWAAMYVRELRLTPKAPVKALATKENYAEATVREFIHTARQRELLTRSRRGQSGGQLTPKALALLEQGEESDDQPT